MLIIFCLVKPFFLYISENNPKTLEIEWNFYTTNFYLKKYFWKPWSIFIVNYMYINLFPYNTSDIST